MSITQWNRSFRQDTQSEFAMRLVTTVIAVSVDLTFSNKIENESSKPQVALLKMKWNNREEGHFYVCTVLLLPNKPVWHIKYCS